VPAYIVDGQNTNTPVTQLQPASGYGAPGYAFGSKSQTQPSTKMFVSKSAVATDVVTLTVQIVEGNIPAVGNTAYITATSNNGGALNQPSGVVLTGVSITATTGAGTITYAASTGNLSPTADGGIVIVPVPEVAEAFAQGKSKQFAISGYGISWAYTCPSQPGSIAIQLEGAIDDVDSEYTIIGTSQTTTSGYNEVFATLPELVRFVRLNITGGSGGTLPTIIGKILNS
jgi:hypothetical protein